VERRVFNDGKMMGEVMEEKYGKVMDKLWKSMGQLWKTMVVFGRFNRAKNSEHDVLK
jgi:hypothetical protein